MVGKQVIITAYPDGTVKIEAEGYVGAACKAATEKIEAALGGTVLQAHDKPEMFQAQQVQEQKASTSGW